MGVGGGLKKRFESIMVRRYRDFCAFACFSIISGDRLSVVDKTGTIVRGHQQVFKDNLIFITRRKVEC